MKTILYTTTWNKLPKITLEKSDNSSIKFYNDKNYMQISEEHLTLQNLKF